MIALVALGYTMVYGILKLINFAHSEVFMMGAYAGLFLIAAFGGASLAALRGRGGHALRDGARRRARRRSSSASPTRRCAARGRGAPTPASRRWSPRSG